MPHCWVPQVRGLPLAANLGSKNFMAQPQRRSRDEALGVGVSPRSPVQEDPQPRRLHREGSPTLPSTAEPVVAIARPGIVAKPARSPLRRVFAEPVAHLTGKFRKEFSSCLNQQL